MENRLKNLVNDLLLITKVLNINLIKYQILKFKNIYCFINHLEN